MQIWQIICMKYINVKYKIIKAKIASQSASKYVGNVAMYS